ncbi:MAG: hypothetical protein AAF514_14550, partial [Verrucomicrobiota bacterium]
MEKLEIASSRRTLQRYLGKLIDVGLLEREGKTRATAYRNSSRLEGNTYSLLETDHLLKQGQLENGGRAREAQMILNHKAAVEFLVDEPMELGYNRYTFLNLHAILVEALLE